MKAADAAAFEAAVIAIVNELPMSRIGKTIERGVVARRSLYRKHVKLRVTLQRLLGRTATGRKGRECAGDQKLKPQSGNSRPTTSFTREQAMERRFHTDTSSHQSSQAVHMGTKYLIRRTIYLTFKRETRGSRTLRPMPDIRNFTAKAQAPVNWV